MKRIFYIIALSLLPFAANAETLDLKYEALWNGIKAGTARVTINDTGTTYTDTVRADAVGLVQTFTHYWTDNTITGSLVNGKYSPVKYYSKWQPKKAAVQTVVVNYAKDGTVNEVATPPENRGKRPEVAPKDKHGVPDPITVSMIARDKVREMVKAGANFPQNFTLRTFDSRRVTDLNFDVTGYVTVKLDGKPQKLLEITFSRTAVTGYNKKELEAMKTVNPLINIYVNDDLIPVYAAGQSIIGEISVKLVRN